MLLGGAAQAVGYRGGDRADGRLSARAAARSAETPVALYAADVRASGQLIVSFHGDRGSGCALTGQCAVRSGTMTWTPPSTGALEVEDLGTRGHPRLQAFLDLGSSGQPPARATVQRAYPDGIRTCVDVTRFGEDARLPVSSDVAGGLTFGLYAAHPTFELFGPPHTPLTLAYGFLFSAPQADEPAPTRCGGPLPSDFLPSVPTQRVALATLRRGATRIDLSGVAPFAAAGLAGTAASTIVLHVRRLRGGSRQGRPRPTPLSDENRVITVEYRVARVAGSVAVDVAGNPSTCAELDACGLRGTLTLRPGPARGDAYVIAYDSATTGGRRLRRSVGLAPGKPPPYAQVSGLAKWTSSAGTITAAIDRNGTQVCNDTAPIPVGAVELEVKAKRVTATFGGSGYAALTPSRDALRTRCQGPTAADVIAHNAGLATAQLPLAALRRRTLTVHLTTGAAVTAPGFTWRSRPDLTIVLRQTGVTERLVPSSAFQT